ncbi:MAG: molybdenum cofactor biosysynthesis protein [Microbacteriaceae bacterium]
MRVPVEIVELLASPAHRYDGRPADGPDPAPLAERHDRIELRAGLGAVGDRFFNAPAHRRDSVTVMAAESLEAVAAELALDAVPGLAQTRRTILLRGADVDALVGLPFAIEQGGATLRLQGHRAASPCAWMDRVIAPGAFRALRGRGGVRCEPLDDGVLRIGPAMLVA